MRMQYLEIYILAKKGGDIVVKSHLRNMSWDHYGYWLIDRVGFKKKRYEDLVFELHTIPFSFCIASDESRVADGLELRDEYYLEMDYISPIFKDEKCSVLEVLVALAIRIECEYIGDPREEHPEQIFWEMVGNLFNIEQNWRLCTSEIDRDFIHKKVDIWIKRRFNYDGSGSIFPLKNPDCDQADVNIWGQMNRYLMENYPI